MKSDRGDEVFYPAAWIACVLVLVLAWLLPQETLRDLNPNWLFIPTAAAVWLVLRIVRRFWR